MEDSIWGVPYADKVKFYADHDTKKIINVQRTYTGKGWYDIRVGSHTMKTRNPVSDTNKLLEEHYPTYTETSLFSETSYHSALTQGKAGKIDTYGTNEYNKDISFYKPLGEYQLLQPVKTTSKQEFGKVIEKVMISQWRYIVIDWIPENGKIYLQVKDTIHDPIKGEDKVLYKSKKFSESQKEEVYELFNQRVEEAREW
jgi:hypothetical protein